MMSERAKRPADPDSEELVLPFSEIRSADLPAVGGKGANLGEMAHAGFPVPPGFCVTTLAFRRFLGGDDSAMEADYTALDALDAEDVEAARAAGKMLRGRLVALPIPAEVEDAIVAAWEAAGSEHAYAVRSSATAEDLPGASFAGQQDTYLNIRGREALLDAVRRAWASLFTDRAILYRMQKGFGHRGVALSVVVQRMVLPEVSGILFTADPLGGHRSIASIDAGFGLGEALVSGIVSADLYRVDKRSLEIVERRIADKKLAILSLPEGGTETVDLGPDRREASSLSDAQAIALTKLGSRIESHYGQPQDIEWVIDAAGEIFIVQSRPITSLFPLPPRPEDDALHLYFSFSHAQVMTDAMPPMGRSVLRTVFPFGKGDDPLSENPYLVGAGGRLYVDATPALRFKPMRHVILRFLGVVDALMQAAVQEVVQRPGFFDGDVAGDHGHSLRKLKSLLSWIGPIIVGLQRWLWLRSPDRALAFVDQASDAVVDDARAAMGQAQPGAARLREAQAALAGFLPVLLRVMPPVLASGMASRALLGKLAGRRGDPDDLDALARGLDGNVTTMMDLETGDLADVARAHPSGAVGAALSKASSIGRLQDPAGVAELLDSMRELPGGPEFMSAFETFLDHYGMRGPSEIDISRRRWREDPSSLLQVVAGSLRGEEGAHRAHHARLKAQGEAAGKRLVEAAGTGLLGPIRRPLAARFARLARAGIAVREHPKFAMIRVMGLTKDAIVESADLLVAAGRLDAREEVWWLGLGELVGALESPTTDLRERIKARKAEEERYPELRPPRVMTSEGEIPEVKQDASDAPDGALVGNAASSGIVEGRVRVVLDPTTTLLEPGEILVAPFTDPGWTPLFINAAALVMEVGGLMTHGSVVAREYGIPAVVGALDATTTLETGQWVRVNGDRGWVEVVGQTSTPALDSATE